MEAAARVVQSLSKAPDPKLPDEPHCLVLDTATKFPTFSDSTRPFPEWYNPRLQYLTLISEPDRGVCYPRPVYEMRADEKPVPKEVDALAKPGDKKKKLSLSDYNRKKTSTLPGASPSAAPSPSPQTHKPESERATSTSNPSSIPTLPPALDQKRAVDGHRSSTGRHRESGAAATANANASDPKPPLARGVKPDLRLPPKPPTPETKKRHHEDDQSRPLKRARPDDKSQQPPSQPPRDDTPRRVKDQDREREKERPRERDREIEREKDRDSERDRDRHKDRDRDRERDRERERQRDRDKEPPPPRDKDTVAPRDDDNDATTNQSQSNGKSSLSRRFGPNTSSKTSPAVRPHNSPAVVNGGRPQADSTRSTPKKTGGSRSQSSVPPLLSPLHLGCFDEDVSDSRKRHDPEDGPRAGKPKKPQTSSSMDATSKSASRRKMPPLLSPTLPPEVEAALEKQQRSSSTRDEDRHTGSERPAGSKRPQAEESDEESSDLQPPLRRGRCMVKLKVPKRLRANFKSLMRLSKRDTTSTSQPSKRPANDNIDLGVASKRPRASDVGGKLPLAPSTPLKKNSATAMSRVSSTNSYANTPGDNVHTTPSVALGHSTDRDRLPNGQVQGDPRMVAGVKAKGERLFKIARTLKHEADKIIRKHQQQGSQPEGRISSSSSNGMQRSSETPVKLSTVLQAECIINFMTSFTAQMTEASISGKGSSQLNTSWESLFPYMEEKKQASRHCPPLHLLFMQLQAFSVDQLLKIYVGHRNMQVKEHHHAASGHGAKFEKYQRMRFRLLDSICEAVPLVRDARYRLNMTPWSTMEEVGEQSLRILRFWCNDESVEWTPHSYLREEGIRDLETYEKDGKWVIRDSPR